MHSGCRFDFTASKIAALVMVIGGVYAIGSPSGSTLLGIGLILGAGALYSRAREVRTGYLHHQKMTGLWQWAQGLGPRRKPRR